MEEREKAIRKERRMDTRYEGTTEEERRQQKKGN